MPESSEEQDAICEKAQSIDARIQIEKRNIDKLVDVKKGLMQDLLTGRVQVTIQE